MISFAAAAFTLPGIDLADFEADFEVQIEEYPIVESYDIQGFGANCRTKLLNLFTNTEHNTLFTVNFVTYLNYIWL